MSRIKNSSLKHVSEDLVSNETENLKFSSVWQTRLSRRHVLQAGGALGLTAYVPQVLASQLNAAVPSVAAGARTLGFKPVPFSTADAVLVPEGYRAEAFYRWGDPVGIAGNMPPFKPDGSNTTLEQAAQAGMHHDGMSYFSLPLGGSNAEHGLLAMNHEYVDLGLLYPDGEANWDLNKARKAQNAMGVSVLEAKKNQGQWQVVAGSRYARRITANTPMSISGPAKGHPLLRTQADKKGEKILGTMQNCANGQTPWGTYLTCEENWSDIFVKASGELTPLEKRYGIATKDSGYRWSEVDERFDVLKTPNEPNRFGWVVEIDPFDPKSTPVKHTALGRIKHEGAIMAVAPDGRVVVYMGDDQKFEYIYKFVSAKAYQPNNRAANMRLLTEGTLYVAKFNDDGTGVWLPLVHGQGPLTSDNDFNEQAEVLINTRRAADLVGATKMDRPEWIAVDPTRPGSVYCTLTNNNDRGKEGQPATDAANPRANNLFGHIIHWQEQGGDVSQLAFGWDILALAGSPFAQTAEHQPKNRGDAFGSPDGLSFDHNGVLWVETDVSTSTLNQKDYAGMGNNQMLAVVPETGEFKRFLTGPNGCEITGIAFTPDNRTLFINIQHPGEPADGPSDHLKPKAISSWPDGGSGGRPRSATVVIQKIDGGVIGS